MGQGQDWFHLGSVLCRALKGGVVYSIGFHTSLKPMCDPHGSQVLYGRSYDSYRQKLQLIYSEERIAHALSYTACEATNLGI